MAFAVNRLKTDRSCSVFSDGTLGGAWAEAPLGGLPVSLACNGIGGYKSGEDQLDRIEKFLVDAGADLLRVPGPLPGTEPDGHGPHLVGRIMPAVEGMLSGPSVSIHQVEVNNLDILSDRVIIEGEEFGAIFLPEHFKVKNLTVLGSQREIFPNTVRSMHFRVLFSESQEGPVYDVEWDSVFDRGGIQYPHRNVFLGRVRRELKGRSPDELLLASEWLSERSGLILEYDVSAYDSHWISDSELTELAESLQQTTSCLVPTQSIFRALDFAMNLSAD